MTETQEQRFEVQNRDQESRYVLIDDQVADDAAKIIGEEAYVDVDSEQTVHRVLFHTEVSESYGGQGLASLLVKEVVDDVISRGYLIVPVCPYVAKWLPRHPEYDAYVVKPRPVHLRAVDAVTKQS